MMNIFDNSNWGKYSLRICLHSCLCWLFFQFFVLRLAQPEKIFAKEGGWADQPLPTGRWGVHPLHHPQRNIPCAPNAPKDNFDPKNQKYGPRNTGRGWGVGHPPAHQDGGGGQPTPPTTHRIRGFLHSRRDPTTRGFFKTGREGGYPPHPGGAPTLPGGRGSGGGGQAQGPGSAVVHFVGHWKKGLARPPRVHRMGKKIPPCRVLRWKWGFL